MTSSGAVCQQRCIKGEGKYNGGISASAQQSEDKATVVVRLANTADKSMSVVLDVPGYNSTSASVWVLVSSMDTLDGQKTDANTPSQPERVSPVLKQAVDLSAPLVLPPISAAVAVLTRIQ
jgi:alpha-L-arabinofuranosidase